MRILVSFLIALLMILPASVFGEEQQSRWSAYLLYSEFSPDLADWEQGYGDRDMHGWQVGISFKAKTWLEFGLATGYHEATGQGFLPLNDTTGGQVEYLLAPVELYLEVHGRFSASQWLVPYIGGGYSYVFYQLDITNQEEREGKAQGHHYKLGVRASLNPLDPAAARQLQKAWGIERTSVLIEAKSLNLKKNNLDLGGRSYSLGLVFEF